MQSDIGGCTVYNRHATILAMFRPWRRSHAAPSVMDAAPIAGLHEFVECRFHAGHKPASSDLGSTGLDRGETRRSRPMMEIAHSFFDTAISYYLIVGYVVYKRCWTSPLKMV